MTRAVVVTGIGLLSSLGEGEGPHVAAIKAGVAPKVDTASFAPYPVHPLGPVELDRQIPKKSDQRQMEPWQRIGVYAAGLALDSAGLKDDAEAKSRLQVIVAAGGGERDHAVDGQILTGLRSANDPGSFLNERLVNDLRPTLFLAQLSNLLAGNISIVHGITGASRTFMGEEQAGVDAIRIAQARIASGQADTILVGGSYNAERRDMLLLFELGGFCQKGDFVPVFERGPDGGLVSGSFGAFLVLEAAETAAARGAKPMARIGAVAAGRSKREAGQLTTDLVDLAGKAGIDGSETVILSGATGIGGPTAEEAQALVSLAPKARCIAAGDFIGHGVEAAFPACVALSAALIGAGETDAAMATGVAHWRGEGIVRLSKA
jgi:3-oxoacyl-[acyl-carrier-protein] synthase II